MPSNIIGELIDYSLKISLVKILCLILRLILICCAVKMCLCCDRKIKVLKNKYCASLL